MKHANDNHTGLRFLSVCSGIEAASVAWHPLGWKAVAFSEIEKFPSAVLKHHYPDVPNLGDFTKIDTKTLGRVDILAGGTPCFTAGHLVLTEGGYAPIESISVGDKVVTHKGRLRTVVRIGNEVKEVGVMSGVGMCEPITCTADHPFLAVEWRNQNTKRKNVYAKVEHCGRPDWVAASNMPGKQWCQLTTHANDNRQADSAKFGVKTAMYVAGMYLGDGWIRRVEGKNKKSVVLGINPRKYEKLLAVIGNVVHTVSRERTIVRVSIHDTAFAEWLESEFAHYSHLKTVPAWVMGHEFRAEFLRGFLDADGHVTKSGKVSVSTTSRSLAYGISDLLAAEGYVSSVSFVATPDTCVIEGRTCNQKDYYQIRAYPLRISRKARVRHGMVLRAVSGFALSGSDTVFNIEVEEDHSYVVQGAIVHNCQAFSVAGLRGGLNDERGNLTLKFVELAHELAANNGLRNAVWENVVGVLSDKGNAFGCFLAGLVGANAPIKPTGRWTSAGMVSGPRGRAAWRVLDAQYFGVAQRRRRVLVVADFGNGADPAKVLLIEQGLPRHPPARGETGKDVAPTISARTKGGGGLGTDFDLDGGLVRHSVDVAPCLRAGGNSTGGDRPYGTDADTADSLIAYTPEIARCDATREGSSQDYETTTMVAVGVTGDIAHTLKAEGADASEYGTGRGTPIICFTAKDYGADAHEELAPTLRSGNHSGSHANGGVMPAVTVAIRGRDGGATAELGGEVATALRASQGGGDKPHVLVDGLPETAGTMKACAQSGGFSNSADHAAAGYMVPVTTSAVRRLTPRECERLQGFEDNYTRIPIKHYATQKITKNRPADMWEKDPNGGWWLMAADGPRYKSLGNSWAVPKFQWLGMRLDAAYKSLRLGQTPQGQPQEASKRFSPANDVHDHEPQRSQKHAG